jgi:hypothetical protein
MSKRAFSGVDILEMPRPFTYRSLKSWDFLISWCLMIKSMKELKFYKLKKMEFFHLIWDPLVLRLLRFAWVIREALPPDV